MNHKEPVRLRQRTLKDGSVSLYLDIYYKGKRSYDFLGLYLLPETSRENREKNNQTLRLAEAIKAKRVLDLINGTYNIGIKTSNDILLSDYIKKVFSSRKESTRGTYNILINHIKAYDQRARVKDVDKKWLTNFRKYLESYRSPRTGRALNNNTKNGYLSYLAIGLKQAVKDEILDNDPCIHIDKFKKKETNRNYLTIDEVRIIANSDYTFNPRYKDAFVFSCLTGLRKSDIIAMRWKNITTTNNGTTILEYRQVKTGHVEHLDISEQAVKFMGERGGEEDSVFQLGGRSMYNEVYFHQWIKDLTGKDITFHCGRHTFAVMMLTLGVDIYTLQKLLGHTDIKTTQIYAKIVDEKKQKAVSLIPQI